MGGGWAPEAAKPAVMVYRSRVPATGSLVRCDDARVAREQPVPAGVVLSRQSDRWKRLRGDAGLPSVAHRVQGREIRRIAGSTVGVREDVVDFGCERSIGRVHGAAAVMS